MLILRITMMEGRTAEQKRELMRRLCEAASHSLDLPLQEVRMVFQEVPPLHWGVGGVPMSERQGGDSDGKR